MSDLPVCRVAKTPEDTEPHQREKCVINAQEGELYVPPIEVLREPSKDQGVTKVMSLGDLDRKGCMV